MKHTECKKCKLRQGDCGHHFKMDGITNYDIPSLSGCDQYGNCMFFQPEEQTHGNVLVSREALKLEFSKHEDRRGYLIGDWEDIIDSVDAPRLCQKPSLYAAKPIPNHYKKVIDCGAHLLECPSCKSRIVLNAFTYAVGCLGYAFCPYCGFDVREKEVKNYEDSQL